MLGFSLELGLLVLIACVLGGGICGAAIRTWSILARLYSLEDRVSVTEGTLLREVKTRAAMTRGTRSDKDVLQVDEGVLKPAPSNDGPWWAKIPRAYPGK